MKVTELPYEAFVKNYDQFISQYDESIDWLDSLGLPYSRTRFGKYKKAINSIPELFENANKIGLEEFKERVNICIRSMSETAEILRIHKEYTNRENVDFIDQLKKVMSGRQFRNESNKDPARDFSFEL